MSEPMVDFEVVEYLESEAMEESLDDQDHALLHLAVAAASSCATEEEALTVMKFAYRISRQRQFMGDNNILYFRSESCH